MFDLRLKDNFKLFIAGPSGKQITKNHNFFLTLLSPGCGKTTLIKNIIENITTFTSSPPNKVVYFYTEWQNKFDIMKASFGVEFIEDNDNMLNFIKDLNTSAFVIFDDMMNSDNLKSVAQIFTVHGRHLNLSLAFLSQKLFNNNEHFRQISQNSDYMCVFKNPRNSLDIRNLSNQITPKSNALSHIYQKATVKPYSYIFINLTQEAVPQLKFINNIFSSDHIINAYVLTNCEWINLAEEYFLLLIFSSSFGSLCAACCCSQHAPTALSMLLRHIDSIFSSSFGCRSSMLHICEQLILLRIDSVKVGRRAAHMSR